jgi:hypothetical protein
MMNLDHRTGEKTTQPGGGNDFLIQLIPILLLSLIITITAYKLAKEKGRNVALWTILGAIPFLNFFFIWFFVGAANLRLERRIDELSKRISGVN